jgi:hypothetical protein
LHIASQSRKVRAFKDWKEAVNSFQTWEQNNLAKFAAEANKKVLEQQEEIKALRDDLRVALDAYRELLTKEEIK